MAQLDILQYIRQMPNNNNVNVIKGLVNSSGGGGSELEDALVARTLSQYRRTGYHHENTR